MDSARREVDSGFLPPGRANLRNHRLYAQSPRCLVCPTRVLGQVFYAALVIGVLTGQFEGGPLNLYLLASLVTVVLGAYLTYSLLFLTRVPCKLCFTSHFINLVIFIMLLTLR